MSSLYLNHFGLQKHPFKITPDPDFFFTGGRRGDALAALEHVAATEEGIIVVVAEVGSGKTLLARLLLQHLGDEVRTVYLSNPVFSRDEILSAIARDLGIVNAGSSTESKLYALQAELLRCHAAGHRVLLVIDEAHAMPPESLEEIRLLSNLETAENKLINIMLFGQPELDVLLAQKRLRQVRDRVVHRFELQPLPYAEACAYVDHRLRAAGWRGGSLFHPNALALLVKASGGRARKINLLADKALLGAYAQGLQQVGVAQIKEASAELQCDPTPAQRAPRNRVANWLWWSSSLVMALFFWGASLWWMRSTNEVAPSRAAPTGVVSPAAPVSSAPSAALPSPTTSAPVNEIQATLPASMPTIAPTLATAVAAVNSASDPVTAPTAILSPTRPASSDLGPGVAQVLAPYLRRLDARLNTADISGYTVQLASLPRDEAVVTYLQRLAQLVDSAMVSVQLSTYNGRPFVSVFYGHYANVSEASRALGGLPEVVKVNKPMLRTWTKIKLDQSF